MSSDHEIANTTPINTSGGAVVDGAVNTGGGDFVGRDKITITEEVAYTVHGLANPYLGLRAFRYEDRAIYAGREQLAQETIQRLTAPGAQQTLLFITGASGSGKSSFAQAGLIPLLESHYAAYQKTVRHAILRPSSQPLVMLADALQKLHPDLTPETLATHPPKDQINLLLIDQFEELFIQSEASQRTPFCDFLTNLPSFATSRAHILITLRVDYLDELFAIQRLWAKFDQTKVELRTMSADDLRNAIQKPLQVHHPQKRFAPELLDRLVQDGGADAALLPLLQVTLAELWKTRKLVLSNYHSLTNAIRQRAELVYACSDHASADPKTARPAQDQQTLMSILLDLINVSVDGDDRRDARQRRTRQELEQGSTQRPRLIEELVNARLLAAASETRNGAEVEVIDIIHESLIDNWDRLRSAIEEQRQQLQRRARFKLWLREWLRNGRQDGYLLMDMLLAEARVLVEKRDIEVQGLEAQEFYLCSLEYQASAQHAKDKAEAERKTRQQWLQRARIALVITMIAAGIFLWLWQRTEDAKYAAETAKAAAEIARNESERLKEQIRADQIAQKALLSNFYTNPKQYPQRALWLAIEAVKAVTPPIPSALQNLYDLLGRTPGRWLGAYQGYVYSKVAFSPDGKILASASSDKTILLWQLNRLADKPVALEGSDDYIFSIAFAPDGKTLASGNGNGTIYLWSLIEPENEPLILKGHEAQVWSLAFSPDGKALASASWDKTVRLWSLVEPKHQFQVYRGHEAEVHSIAFSPDGKTLASGSKDETVRLWSLIEPESDPMILNVNSGISSVAFSPDGKTLAAGGGDQMIRLWSLTAPDSEPLILDGYESVIESVAFSPNGQILAAAGWTGTIHLWSLTEPDNEPLILKAHEEAVYSIAFAPDSKILASIGTDGVRIWPLEKADSQPVILQGYEASVLPSSNSVGVNSVAFSPDGKILASAGEDATIRLWSMVDLESNPLMLKAYEDDIKSVAFSPDGKLLASASWDRIQIWTLTKLNEEPLMLIGGGVWSMAFAPDGKTLISGGFDGTIRRWSITDLSSESLIFKGHEGTVRSIAFSPNGEMIAVASGDGYSTIRIWSLAELSNEPLVLEADGHRGMAWSISFSPDGKTIASAGWDGTIRLWSLDKRDTKPVVLTIPAGYVTSITFAPDGKTLVSAGPDSKIQFWPLEAEDLVIQACTTVGRNLSMTEWQQYFPNEEYRITCPQWP